MPAELLNLKEQLANLQVVLEAALKSGKSMSEIVRLQEKMLELQDRIIKRQEHLSNLPN